MTTKSRVSMLVSIAATLALAALSPGAAWAIAVPEGGGDPLEALAFVSDKLRPQTVAEPIEDVSSELGPEVRDGWASFRAGQSGEWRAHVDRRTGRIDFAEGAGIPWVPGRGNGLAKADVAHLNGRGEVDLGTLEQIARGFVAQVAHLLGVQPPSLVLNRGRSGQPAEHLWFVDFDVQRDGLPVEGARVVFRVNNGNLIQFGSENLPPGHVPTPQGQLQREEALARVADHIGGFSADDVFLDNGSLRLLTVAREDAGLAEGFPFGDGRGLAAAWQFTFRREGYHATWRARVDADTGEILELRDVNRYASATGGVKFLGVASTRPMPFADTGLAAPNNFTSSAGVYNYPGGAATSTLAGQFVRISDSCGPISLAADAAGNFNFGTSAGTDCTTPGVGGAGNTHASRTQFYHVNRIKEMGRGWLPGNAWLNEQLTASVNMTGSCNAFWNGTTINFYRSGSGCGNMGEIEGVSLHEYGHGLDDNDGSDFAFDSATGETYGDVTAALATHTSCIGPGYQAVNCGGYGDACTSCTGIRDIDWAKHTSNTPHTVANFTLSRCAVNPFFPGPCGREGHCESYVASEAIWDLAARDLPGPGTSAAWAVVDRLWYLSRSTATDSFTCAASGTSLTSNGCNTGSLWRTLRAVDDDDGNLANGVPHGGALFAAFNRHGIACTSDAAAGTTFRGCSPPAVPTLTPAAGNNSVTVSWTSSGAGVVYDVYRNEAGCNAGFTKITNDLSGTSFTDNGVANRSAYFYQVVAHRSGNEACAANPTTCQSVTPCAPTTLYSNTFETSTGLSDWGRGSFLLFGSVGSWRGVQSCTAQTGTRIFRYGGGASCTDNYFDGDFNFAAPRLANGISVPAGSTSTRLSFGHRWRFEPGFDGGTLAVTLDGLNFFYIPATAILSGATYNNTIAPDCSPSADATGAAVFSGVQSSFVNTTVDLDAACNRVTGGTGGCAGQTLTVGFTSITDCFVTDDGWFLDNVTISACTP